MRYKNVCHSCSVPRSCKIIMFHHEFIVDNFTVRVNGDVSKLEAFASICPVPANQFMVSAFILNFPRATPLDRKELDNVPRPPPLAQSGLCGAQLALTTQPRHPSTPASQGTSCHASTV